MKVSSQRVIARLSECYGHLGPYIIIARRILICSDLYSPIFEVGVKQENLVFRPFSLSGFQNTTQVFCE